MKKILAFSFIFCALLWAAAACTRTPTGTYGSTPTPTPTPNTSNTGVGATVSGGNYFFSPSTVTINHGQSVVWDTSLNGHTVTLDGFSGPTGTTGTNMTSFPVTFTFSTAGTYYYHCGVSGHSGCGTTTYGVCGGGNGMIGSVVVN